MVQWQDAVARNAPSRVHSLQFILELLLLLLSRFSRVQLCATPQMAAHQAPPSLGFSRQEHWSGLPFPSPMHESEKWKWSRSVVSDSQQPHAAFQAPPSMGFSRQEYWSGVPLPSLMTKLVTWIHPNLICENFIMFYLKKKREPWKSRSEFV